MTLSLSTDVFPSILIHWGPFDIDLLASRLNNKVNEYFAWEPDPGTKFIDAFSFSRETFFLPFHLSAELANACRK